MSKLSNSLFLVISLATTAQIGLEDGKKMTGERNVNTTGFKYKRKPDNFGLNNFNSCYMCIFLK